MTARLLSIVALVFTASLIVAQPSIQKADCSIQGVVVSGRGEPLKKAMVEVITDNQKQGSNYAAVTDPQGHFRIEAMLPGRYSVFVEHTGFLLVDKQGHPSSGKMVSLAPGQRIDDLLVRMLPAAVISGRTIDQDGDPLPSVEITLWTQSYSGGHLTWTPSSSERSNDIGEYRLGGLTPGRYLLSANPPPTFLSLAGSLKVDDQTETNPGQSYVTTFYPGVTDRAEATPIDIHAGDQFPADFTLVQSRTFHIRGIVANVPAHTKASVMLHAREFSLVTSIAELGKDGTFDLHDVSPGTYTVMAVIDSGEMTQTARQTVNVVASDIDELRLLPAPGTTLRGHVRVENAKSFDPSQFFVYLRTPDGDDPALNSFPWGGNASSAPGHVSGDGSFVWNNVPPGTYTLQVTAESPDQFLKTVTVDGKIASDGTVTVSGGSVSLELAISGSAGKIDGTVVDGRNLPVANATVVAVPEPKYRNMSDRYKQAVADQQGHFVIRGLVPGTYTILAFDELEGEPYYDPEFMRARSSEGKSLKIAEGSRESLVLKSISQNPELQQSGAQ
ncbi:MAG TPA: carboxypeptidase regulatory-like domain-containing protein [Terriglobales bacterium]|nr:carboxypeptidase regulatory-like domain-containing protein [Terriglobales bacterium]